MAATCADCRFYRIHERDEAGNRIGGSVDDDGNDDSDGECRIRAPRIYTGGKDGANTWWPDVRETDWCGEHQSTKFDPYKQ